MKYMKNFFLFLLAFIVGGISIFAVGIFTLTKSPVDNWEGTVRLEIINFDVSVKQGNSGYELLSGNMILEEGDSVKTGPDGEAEIIIADGSVIRLAPDSELLINQMNLESLWKQDVNVSLTKGKLWFRIIKIFDDGSSWEAETPTVVATVRGTAFGMEVMEDGNVDVLVAESEVFIKGKDPRFENKQAVAVAGQRMEIGRDFEVKKEKLELNNREDQELRIWLDGNLELDRVFQEEVQEIINYELLEYLEEEPGSFMYEMQLFAEDFRMDFSGEEEKQRLEDLQADRRMAETLWLIEEENFEELDDFLIDLNEEDFYFDDFDILPQLIEFPESEMDDFWEMDFFDEEIWDEEIWNEELWDDNTFDLESLEESIELLDSFSGEFDYYADFEYDPDMEFVGPEYFYEFDEAMDWVEEYPEYYDEMMDFEYQFELLPENDMDGYYELFNDPEYLEILDIMEDPYYIEEPIYMDDPMYFDEPEFIEDPYSFDDPYYIEEPGFIDDPYYIEEPMYIEEPVYYDDPYYIEEPMYIEEPVYFEEPLYIN